MPKLSGLTDKQKINHQHEVVTNRCRGLMAEKNLKQRTLAEHLGISEMTISRQFNDGKITTPVLIGILMLTHADQEEIERILKL